MSNREDPYLDRRKRVSESIGAVELWSVIDQWPLYVGVKNLARFLAISRLFEETLSVPGHVAEFGSWKGANLMFLAKILSIHDPLSDKKVHCFESFGGLTTFDNKDGHAVEQAGAYKGNYEQLVEMLDLYEMQNRVLIHRGLIQDTLPVFLEKDPGVGFSFVYCDTDLFEPTALVLDRLHSHLSVGGFFVFDEWNFPEWPGETLAVREFLDKQGGCYEAIHVKRTAQPSLVLKKIRIE